MDKKIKEYGKISTLDFKVDGKGLNVTVDNTTDKVARSILNEMLYYKCVPVEVEKVWSLLGFNIKTRKLQNGLNAFVYENNSNDDNLKEIVFNTSVDGRNRRYILAKELGKYITNKNENKDLYVSINKKGDKRVDYSEIWSNRFAKDLLMPHESFDEVFKYAYLKRIGDYDNLLDFMSNYYDVPTDKINGLLNKYGYGTRNFISLTKIFDEKDKRFINPLVHKNIVDKKRLKREYTLVKRRNK